MTVTTFPSSMSSSRALWHSSLTCASGIGRHALNCAIALDDQVSGAQRRRRRNYLLVQVTHLASQLS